MDAKDAILSQLVSDDSAERHPLKQVVHLLEDTLRIIDVLIESLCAFLAESEEPVHITVFMIASEEEDLSWVFQLEGEEKANHLETLTATVDVISQENIIEAANVARLLWRPPNVKETHQAIVVAVNVAKYLDRGLQLLDEHRLLLEHLHDFVDKLDHVLLLDDKGSHQWDRLLAVSWRQQVLDENRVKRLVLVLLDQWGLHIGSQLSWLLLQFVDRDLAHH